MHWLRKTLYFIILLLSLEVVKTLVLKMPFIHAYRVAVIISCIKFLLLLAAFFMVVFFFLQRKRGAKKKWWVPVTVFFLLIAAAEGLFTWQLYHPARIPAPLLQPFQYYYDYYTVNLLQFEKGKAVYDSRLFYTLQPNSSFVFSNAEFNDSFWVNTKGLRDDEASLQAPQIICLGDSYTMGWGVGQQAAFPQQLEALSHKKVLNAGISSYGTAREIALLQTLDTTRLESVVIQYCTNDQEENTAYVQNNHVLKVSSAGTYDSAVRLQQSVRAYFPGKHFLITGQLFLKMQLNKLIPLFKLRFDRNVAVTGEQQQALLFLDILMRANINFSKVKVVVTIMESYHHLHNNFLQELQKLCAREPYRSKLHNAVQVVDLSQVLTKEDYFLLDMHLKPSGQQKTARAIWQALQSGSSLPQ